jgi:hypothetical protein
VAICLRNFELKMGPKTRNVLSTSTLKEPGGFKMIMSTIRVNSFGGKEIKLLFLIVFVTYLLIGLLKCQV